MTHASEAVAVTTIPMRMNFQGRLTDASGNIKPDGVYNMKFSLYSVSSGGSPVWNEDRLVSASKGVTVTNGLFSVRLGEATDIPASVFASGSLYFEIQLPTPATATTAGVPTWTEPAMTPRNQLAPSAYAFNSETLDGLDSAAFLQAAGNNTLTGTNLFKPSSDTATGFQIQDAAAKALLTADAVDDRIYIGDPTADATGVTLVLDTKNNAGDPTGVDGAMYYNSNLAQFRCYRDGNWYACGVNPIDRGWVVEDEFMGGGTASGSIGQSNWQSGALTTACTVGYNTASGPIVSSDHPGIMRCTTPATAANLGSVIVMGTTSLPSLTLAAGQSMRASIGVGSAAATTQTYRVGVYGGNTTGRSTTGVYWEADPTANANWMYCYGNATPAAVCASSGVPIVADAFVRVGIDIDAVGVGTSTIHFTINGATTTVSGVTLGNTTKSSPAMTCFTQAAAARYCFIDYYQLRGTTSAAR